MEVASVPELELLLSRRPVTCVYFYSPTCPACKTFNEILASQMHSVPSGFPVLKVDMTQAQFRSMPPGVLPRIQHVPCVMVFTQRGYEWIKVQGPLTGLLQQALAIMKRETEVEIMHLPNSVILMTPEEDSDDNYVKGFYKIVQPIKDKVPVSRVVNPEAKMVKILVMKDGKVTEFSPADVPHLKAILDKL